MRHKESLIPKNPRDFKAILSVTILYAPKRKFDDFGYDFDGAFYSLERGVENLRGKFGNSKSDQILEMLAQAKEHYEAGEDRLGGPLLQDVQMMVLSRQPWAYPKELYRWGVDPSLPKLSEADLLNKGDKDA